MLEMALPNTRFLFNLQASSIDEAKGIYEQLRTLCPRS